MITAMASELARAMAGLGDDKYPAPYYVAYTVKDRVEHRIAAKQGAIVLDDTDHGRSAYVDVRVGDYAFDSSEDDQAEWADEPDFHPITSVPLEGHPEGLRHALWLLTDLRYKQAASSYLRLKGRQLFEAAPARKRASHARAPALVYSEAPSSPEVDMARWRALVRRLSALVMAPQKSSYISPIR